jgi:DNA topoisomerase VI subunit A
MLCLVDGDPYGVHIYRVFKFGGGAKLAAMERERLALPGLVFLGIKSGDFAGGEVALTEADRKRCEGLLGGEWVQREGDVLYVCLWAG